MFVNIKSVNGGLTVVTKIQEMQLDHCQTLLLRAFYLSSDTTIKHKTLILYFHTCYDSEIVCSRNFTVFL